MIIKVNPFLNKEYETTISKYISYFDSHSEGSLEQVSDRLDQTLYRLGQLVEVLVERNILSLGDVETIAAGYREKIEKV